MSVVLQVFGSLLLCCMCMSMSITFSWPSSTIRLFSSTNTTLHRPMTETEQSLFGSLSSLGGLIATPIVGFLLDILGRRKTAIIFSLFGVVSWGIIAACNRVELLLFAMFVTGLSGASFLVVPVYISEICNESIRGAMTSGTLVFFGIGALLSYLMGGALSYYHMVYTCLTIAAIVSVSISFLKESPTFLLSKGREKEAIDSLIFYKKLKPGSKELQNELDIIKRSLQPDFEATKPEAEKLNPETETQEKLSTVQFLKKSASSRKAFYLVLFFMSASIFEGPVILQVYAELLFGEAIPSISPNTSSIIMAVVALIGNSTAGYLTERLGRRPLMNYSSLLVCLSSLLLGLQLHLRIGPVWLVAVSIYLYLLVFSIGAGTLPSVIMAEVFLPQMRSILSMVVVEWAWLCNSIVLYIFNPIMLAIGLGPVFYIFSAISLISAVVGMLYLPETKGLTVDEIQVNLMKKQSMFKW